MGHGDLDAGHAAAHPDVEVIETHRRDLDAHLTRTGFGNRGVDDPERLRAAVLHQVDGAHGSAPLEVGLALLDEGGDALLRVGGGEQTLLELALEGETGLERQVDAALD